LFVLDPQFACEACIRGHRQATCAHTDRPLREIARRGRPVTACAHCRELRLTNNAHRTCT
ncbi:copper fist DNA binding domain-containing protein, partial [Rhodotorula diobovata]